MKGVGTVRISAGDLISAGPCICVFWCIGVDLVSWGDVPCHVIMFTLCM